jgi:hypothetical protein
MKTTRTIRDVLVSVRSKNAGPFTVTFDLYFPDTETFHDMQQRGVISPEVVAELYGLASDVVKIHWFEPALAVKVAVPRLVPGGAPGDTDVAGGQQYAPLLSIPLD